MLCRVKDSTEDALIPQFGSGVALELLKMLSIESKGKIYMKPNFGYYTSI